MKTDDSCTTQCPNMSKNHSNNKHVSMCDDLQVKHCRHMFTFKMTMFSSSELEASMVKNTLWPNSPGKYFTDDSSVNFHNKVRELRFDIFND